MRNVGQTYEIRFSIEVSIPLLLSDLRKDARPGVRAEDMDGMWDEGTLWDESQSSIHRLELPHQSTTAVTYLFLVFFFFFFFHTC